MLVSKSYMVYQKFLSEQAHFKIDVISNERTTDIKQMIDSYMNKLSDEEQKTHLEIKNLKEVIDYLLVTVEQSLADNLFAPFMKSENYRRFKKINTLSSGLNNVKIEQ